MDELNNLYEKPVFVCDYVQPGKDPIKIYRQGNMYITANGTKVRTEEVDNYMKSTQQGQQDEAVYNTTPQYGANTNNNYKPVFVDPADNSTVYADLGNRKYFKKVPMTNGVLNMRILDRRYSKRVRAPKLETPSTKSKTN